VPDFGQVGDEAVRRRVSPSAAAKRLALQRGQHVGGPRLLIYSQDGLGLGHLRRTSAIAAEFLQGRPDACVLTVSDSPLGTFFGIVPNQDYLKLPSLVKSGPGAWDPVSLPLSSGELFALRRDLIASVAASFRPDIVLVDHMPHGARGELVPTLEALRQTNATVVLGLRDILDAPNVVRRTWRDEGAYDAVEQFYDMVLVYGSRDVFDVAGEYGWSPKSVEMLEYCGYVCAPSAHRRARRIRARALGGKPDGRLVVAMAGGGADAYPMMDALLDGLDELSQEEPSALILITGPFMPSNQRRNLMARAQGRAAQVRTSVADVPSYIEAADVVVGMAGYNTTAEVLRSGTPAVLVPRRGPSAEQRMRASLFSERGWVGVVDPDELTASTLARAVRKACATPAPAVGPQLGGLEVAVGHLLSLVEEAAMPPSALLGV
jgi:predicted glycosyltransferase